MVDVIHAEDYKNADLFLKGDKEAGRTLFAPAYETVRRYAKSLVKEGTIRPADVDDIVNETMWRCAKNINRYNGESKFAVFAGGIAKNVLREHLRKNTREALPGSEIIELNMIFDFRNPLSIILEKEKRQIVRQAINSLSSEYKDVIQLRSYNDWKFKQIADVMGKSEDAVYSIYKRALEALRKELKKNYF